MLRLHDAATDLYADLRLTPVLRQVLRHSGRLLATTAGSVAMVDGVHQTYVKVAESGAHCSLGRSFPLDEGLTGQVVNRRGPVVLERYGDLRSGHLPAGHAASAGAAVAVPIWWRGEVAGANIVFACRSRRFTSAEVDDFEALTQLAAPAIVTGGPGDRVDPPSAAEPSPFTPREGEVLALLGRGFGDRAIATELVISRKTVEKHVGAVLRKTATSSRTAAVMHCLERGWLRAPGPQMGDRPHAHSSGLGFTAISPPC